MLFLLSLFYIAPFSRVFVCVRARLCSRACVCVCVCVCVCACVCAWGGGGAHSDIWTRVDVYNICDLYVNYFFFNVYLNVHYLFSVMSIVCCVCVAQRLTQSQDRRFKNKSIITNTIIIY